MADHIHQPVPPYEADATDMYGQPSPPVPQSRNIYATGPSSPSPMQQQTSHPMTQLPKQQAIYDQTPTPTYQQSGTISNTPSYTQQAQQPQAPIQQFYDKQPTQPQQPQQQHHQQHQQHPPAPAPQMQSIQYQTATPLAALNRAPAPVDCPVCHARAMTRTEFVTGNTTHAWALGFCCFTLLFCIPYMINSFKDVAHHCSKCGVLLATWHRSGNVEVHQHA